MTTPELSISAIQSKDQFEELFEFTAAMRSMFPEDLAVLEGALLALDGNTASLMGTARLNGDLCAFFIIGLDEKPILQAFYVPPGLRDNRIGSSLIVAMATMMLMSEVAHISILANDRNASFFERFGAKRTGQGQSSATTDPIPMTFAAEDLKRPAGWFESHVARNERA